MRRADKGPGQRLSGAQAVKRTERPDQRGECAGCARRRVLEHSRRGAASVCIYAYTAG